jgi:hypothetical protein
MRSSGCHVHCCHLLPACCLAHAELLSPDYISAKEGSWPGSDTQVSFLLPLRPLSADVKLPKLCKVRDMKDAGLFTVPAAAYNQLLYHVTQVTGRSG